MNTGTTIMDLDTVRLSEAGDAVVILDQTKLPGQVQFLRLRTEKELWDAIYLLQVRGAPAIGVAAALGMYVLAAGIRADGETAFLEEFHRLKEFLESARPTAVNLSWALNRMERTARRWLAEWKGNGWPEKRKGLLDRLKQEAEQIRQEDIQVCRRIGEYGLTLLKPGDGILTHCNAGQLATSKYGTATAPIYLGTEKGYHFRVFADETRPLLQGARLTATELQASGVDVTLICDNMASVVMKNGWVNAVLVGCDRVAANGDTANKIGTSTVAILAAHYGIPFYVCAPTSTIDLSTPTGEQIRIEQRPAQEVTQMWYREPMAPEGVKVYNPAFDVTDHSLISGIITEYGIARPPYPEAFARIFEARAREAGDAF